MPKKKRTIRQTDARALLSEVLPYELPPTYSNKGMYDFLRRVRLRKVGETWEAKNIGPGTSVLLSCLLGEELEFDTPSSGGLTQLTAVAPGRLRRNRSYPQTVPFQYSVRHKENDYRSLAIMHPRAQIDVADFYRQYAELMLYYTSRSPFSLRHPHKKARYSIVRDWLFERNRVRDRAPQIELADREYEWIRSFFTYERFSNVFQFYDSALYRLCERRYGYLVKVDVAKCFDSIYTHSITWATHGRDLIKANIRESSATFGGRFDDLMQALNHDETSGLLIGSEVSRIFAEIILQSIDQSVVAQLTQGGLERGRDYEILRYVDDYFVFLGDPGRKDEVLGVIVEQLRPFKLHLNAAKEEGEHTPWSSPLTVAKRRVRELIRRCIEVPEVPSASSPEFGVDLPAGTADADNLVVGYKSILIDTGASHGDLANYALAQVERRVEKVIRRSQEVVATITTGTDPLGVEAHFRAVTNALLSTFDFVFFAYSGSPRVSPGVKVARIVSTALEFARSESVPSHDRERVARKFRDEVLMQLNRRNSAERAGVETATLVDCLTDLDPFYALTEKEIERAFDLARDSNGELHMPRRMNALLVFSLLMHIKDRAGYAEVRRCVEHWIVEKAALPLNHAERAIVVLNALASPYVSTSAKDAILTSSGVTDPAERVGAKSLVETWNVDWRGFDLYAALQQKRLYEVY